MSRNCCLMTLMCKAAGVSELCLQDSQRVDSVHKDRWSTVWCLKNVDRLLKKELTCVAGGKHHVCCQREQGPMPEQHGPR